jgi:hypothetical protein
MKYIEIKPGICISIDKIECLEEVDQLHTNVYLTGGNLYKANYPYGVLVTLLEEKSEEYLKRINNTLSTSGYFAG